MEDLLERVVALADAFDGAAIPHSFGGALALGYYDRFRATHDIDVNVYLPSDGAEPALAALAPLGVPAATPEQRAQIERDGQTRLRWGVVPVDLFFSNLPFHAGCLQRRRTQSLLGRSIWILGPEDLVVCKVAFGRAKDDRDIEGLLDAMGHELDVALCLQNLDDILDPEHASLRHFRAALEARSLGTASPDPRGPGGNAP
jgi:hypothetical protein